MFGKNHDHDANHDIPKPTLMFRGNTACRPTAAAGRDRASVWIYDR